MDEKLLRLLEEKQKDLDKKTRMRWHEMFVDSSNFDKFTLKDVLEDLDLGECDVFITITRASGRRTRVLIEPYYHDSE